MLAGEDMDAKKRIKISGYCDWIHLISELTYYSY
jgi:hypothetical protein